MNIKYLVERVHVKRTRGRTNEMCVEMVHVRMIKGERGRREQMFVVERM